MILDLEKYNFEHNGCKIEFINTVEYENHVEIEKVIAWTKNEKQAKRWKISYDDRDYQCPYILYDHPFTRQRIGEFIEQVKNGVIRLL